MTTLYIEEQKLTGKGSRSKPKVVQVKKPADLAKYITSAAKIKQFKEGKRVRVRKGKIMLHIYGVEYVKEHKAA
jgi:hypothetical protein